MATEQRIVSLISSATEMLYLLGLGQQVVGVSHECDWPPDIAGKPRLTRSLVDSAAASRAIDGQVQALAATQSALYAIDVPLLAALQPDLIVTQAQCDVCAVRYEDVVSAVRETPVLGHAQVLALNPSSIWDVFDDVERVGQAARASEQARKVRASLENRVQQVRTTSRQLPPGQITRVVCLEWIDPPMVAANWMPELVAMAGGEPGLTAAGAHSGYADWQKIVEYDPQVIVVMPCGFDLARAIAEAQVLAGWPGWPGLSAVRDRRVFAVDGNAYFNRSGPRLVDSLEILAHLIHPLSFAAPRGEAASAWQRLETSNGKLVPAR